MIPRTLIAASVAAWLTLGLQPVKAADPAPAPQATQKASADALRTRQRMYAYDLMTDAERNEYRERMRAAKTRTEREQLRNEHRERMHERARERGIAVPGPRGGRGPGQGKGPGMGSGMGGGMGQGPGPAAGPGPGAGPGPAGGGRMP